MALGLMLANSLVSGVVPAFLPLDTAISTLHIGNSRTYEENLPAILAQFLTEEGYTAPYCTSYAIGGATLVDHAADVDCATAIDDRVWTHAFLQGATYDMMPANRAANIAAAVTLAGLILTKAPDCEVILYQITALADGHADVDGDPYASPDAMAEENRLGYLEMQAELRAEFPGKLFPIVRHGECIQADGGLYPSTNPDYRDFYDVDLLHPTEDSQFENGAQDFVVVSKGRNPIPHAPAVATWMDVSQSNPIAGDATRMATHAYYFQRYGTYLPNFSTHPVAQAVTEGDTATFTVVARGNPTPTLQWYADDVLIPGATSASYETPVTVLADSGTLYKCRSSNSRGTHDSAEVALTVGAAFSPFKLAFRHQGSGGYDAGTEHTFIPTGGDSLVASLIGTQFPIYDTTGALTPYTFEVLSSTGGGSNSTGTAGAWGTPSSLTSNFWFGTLAGGALTYRINNLPQIALDVWLAGARGGSDSRSTIVEITGTAVKSVTWEAGVSLPVDQPKITDITPDGSGVLALSQGIGAGNNQNFHYNTIIDVRVHTP